MHLLYLYLVIRYSVKLRQQFDAVLPSDQNALQCLTVLLHLCEAHSNLFNITSAAQVFQSDSMTAYGSVCLVLAPALDLRRRYRPG